jgi:hypothetical protein
MLTAPDQKLLEWVRKLRADIKPQGRITRVELYHTQEGELSERLSTIEMADRDEDEDPDDLAQELWNIVEEDLSTRATGSFQRYVVHAYHGDTREPAEAKAFVAYGRLVTALTGAGSEPPTHRGEMAAEMRRTNDLHALMVRMAEQTAGSAALQLQREREENTRLRNVAFDAEKLRQQLLDRELDRELARKDSEASSQQQMMIFGALAQLLPIVVQRVLMPPPPQSAALPLAPAAPVASAAPPPSPGPSPERDAMLAKLFESVSPAQMQQLLAAFRPDQVQQFLGLYTSVRDATATPPGSPSAGNNGSN